MSEDFRDAPSVDSDPVYIGRLSFLPVGGGPANQQYVKAINEVTPPLGQLPCLGPNSNSALLIAYQDG
jgi:hypothetical protein